MPKVFPEANANAIDVEDSSNIDPIIDNDEVEVAKDASVKKTKNKSRRAEERVLDGWWPTYEPTYFPTVCFTQQ